MGKIKTSNQIPTCRKKGIEYNTYMLNLRLNDNNDTNPNTTSLMRAVFRCLFV